MQLFAELSREMSKWSKISPELSQVRDLLGGSEASSGAVHPRLGPRR
jgi:hypothetical protein